MKTRIIKIKVDRGFTRTKIPGAKWVINQYIGCQYSCKYCYAKFMYRWYSYGRWGSWVVVKENMPFLIKNKYVNGLVCMSSVSDPYQPIERRLKLTRSILENMNKRIRLSILTKSDLVLRDIDLFKRFNDIEVGLTVNGFDIDIKRDLEPYSPSVSKRIDALKALHENGVRSYAFISPIIPGLTEVEDIIGETEDFVDYYWFEFLNLKASGREFIEWLKWSYPDSYDTLSDEVRADEYVRKTLDAIKGKDISVKGIIIHYPKLTVIWGKDFQGMGRGDDISEFDDVSSHQMNLEDFIK